MENNKYISRGQMQTLLDARTKGAEIKPILDGFVAKGYTIEGVNDQKKEPEQQGIAPRIVSGIVKPFARLGTNVVNAAQVATGNEPTQPFSGDLLGEVKPVGMQGNLADKAKDIIGTTAEVGSTVLPAGRVGSIVKNVVGGSIKEAIAQGAITGAQSGLLGGTGRDLQKGETVIDSLKTGGKEALIGGAIGSVLGGTGSLVAKGVQQSVRGIKDLETLVPKNLSQKAVDVISADPSIKTNTILKRSTPQELDTYLNIAKDYSVSGEAKSVFEAVGDKLSDTTKVLQTKLAEIGKAKSDIVQPLREGLSPFKKETAPFIKKLESLKNSFTEIDGGSKSKVQAIIQDAKGISTKQGADNFIDKVQDAIYTGNTDMTIARGSALDKQLRGLVGEYNTTLKNSLPKEYAQLNERYSKLVNNLDVINRSLGEVVQGTPIRGSSLIKQYFSPSGSKAKEIFEFIKNETNGEVDLAKDATLAKFAGQLFDDPNVSSLLGGIKEIPTTLGGITAKLAEKIGGARVTNLMRDSTIRKAKSQALPKK